MASKLFALSLRLVEGDDGRNPRLLFARDDEREDSQEWYMDWFTVTGGWYELALCFLAARILACNSSGRTVVGCEDRASCAACVGTCL
jgi:hypothetical protein